MPEQKRTKIVCTIGPASWEPEILTKMIESGMNVARVNGAFADLAELERVENLVRGISNDVGLMLDIKGTEIRMNRFGDPFEVKEGEVLEIGNSDQHKVYPVTYPDLYKDLEVGTQMLFDDGRISAELEEISDGVMKLKILEGGMFKEGKSMNLPGIKLNNPPLTDRDKEQLHFCGQRGWEFVAASFIQSAAEAQLVQDELRNYKTQMIAKIEDQEGVKNIGAILEVVDGVMIARGDMGVEMPFEKLPMVQKDMILRCNLVAKPVITATQMLESMVENDRPTRAEITDVANAIIDGSDAVMLSGETSAGKHPLEAVQAMTRIALEVEDELGHNTLASSSSGFAVVDAIARAANHVLEDMAGEITAVVCVSATMARLLSSYNVEQEIYPFVNSETYRRQLISLSAAIHECFILDRQYKDRDEGVSAVMDILRHYNKVKSGDKVLLLGQSVRTPDDFPDIFEIIEVF